MPLPGKIAIVAALERELWPLVKDWQVNQLEHEGRHFKFFENGRLVVIFGGIGAEPARRATEAVIALFHPVLVQSVGFAGALDSKLEVGDLVSPARVIDAGDGSAIEIHGGKGVLVSFADIASAQQKCKLGPAYSAQAVDMEAAAVARGAQARGVVFSAIKVISDELSCEMPGLGRFIGSDGQFHTASFLAFAALRPWLWPRVLRLAKNNATASKALSSHLSRFDAEEGDLAQQRSEFAATTRRP